MSIQSNLQRATAVVDVLTEAGLDVDHVEADTDGWTITVAGEGGNAIDPSGIGGGKIKLADPDEGAG